MIRKILEYPDPRLKNKNLDIDDIHDPRIQRLLDDLIDTFNASALIGLAGPQIGSNLNVFVTQIRETEYRKPSECDELRVYINPRIIETKGELVTIYEACGSYRQSGMFGPVKRQGIVILEAYDSKGIKFKIETDGILARVILHEMDHLNGKLFIEHTNDDGLITAEDYKKNILCSHSHIGKCRINLKKVS